MALFPIATPFGDVILNPNPAVSEKIKDCGAYRDADGMYCRADKLCAECLGFARLHFYDDLRRAP